MMDDIKLMIYAYRDTIDSPVAVIVSLRIVLTLRVSTFDISHVYVINTVPIFSV